MDPERDDEDPHRGCRSAPKLILAGQIDCMVDGRLVRLIAERKDMVLTVERWRTLLTIRRSSRLLIQSLREFITRSDIRLFVRIGWLGRVEVHPNPSFLIRMLLPLE
jgi:hypothetical protein